MDEFPRSRDPLDVLISREAKTCKGCKHELEGVIWGSIVTVCTKKQKHGRRCKQYEERGKDGMATS